MREEREYNSTEKNNKNGASARNGMEKNWVNWIPPLPPHAPCFSTTQGNRIYCFGNINNIDYWG